jgi:hypothetical protein
VRRRVRAFLSGHQCLEKKTACLHKIVLDKRTGL